MSESKDVCDDIKQTADDDGRGREARQMNVAASQSNEEEQIREKGGWGRMTRG